MLSPEYLLATFSYVGLALIIFAETGLLLGFFLPGDSLLITAGLFAARGDLGIVEIIVLVIVAAFLGNLSGYFIGRRFGPAVFARVKFLKPEYVEQAREYFDERGNQALILARFVPIIRTLLPTLAGTIQMNPRTFMISNAIGAVLWGTSVPLAGYFLGKIIPKDVLDKYILVIVGVILVLSFIPVLLEINKRRRR
ncbi:DedA family protein [Deinococcus psychrotolerans]|uniref:DedA family protein n=1 Tax=Deinococcus psychrotolerans TaxID=2489213 RepID=A0A3G8YBF6_9DEIO|nr:DedA family protein [Deinococcus psychrotolerans]AZI42638.1 DedA family protein [Deinococcus psychrotolerans]